MTFEYKDILSVALDQLVKDEYILRNVEGDIEFLPKGKAWVDKRRLTKNSKATYMDTAIRYLVRKKYLKRISSEEGQMVILTDKGKIAATDIILKGKK